MVVIKLMNHKTEPQRKRIAAYKWIHQNSKIAPSIQQTHFYTIIYFCLLLVCARGDSCGSIFLNKGGEFCSVCQNGSAFVNCTHYYLTNKKAQTLNQADCTAQCCNSTSTIPSQITICGSQIVSEDDSNPSTTLEIVMLVVFFAIPALMGVYLIYSCCKKRRSSQNQDEDHSNRSNRDSKSQIINIEEININSIAPYYLQSELDCSICLDARCDIMTRCGHFFHFQCLTVWTKRSPKCPLCVTNKLNPIVYYCQQCFRSVKLGIIECKKRRNSVEVRKEEVFCHDCILRKLNGHNQINLDDISEIQQERKSGKVNQPPVQSSSDLVRN